MFVPFSFLFPIQGKGCPLPGGTTGLEVADSCLHMDHISEVHLSLLMLCLSPSESIISIVKPFLTKLQCTWALAKVVNFCRDNYTKGYRTGLPGATGAEGLTRIKYSLPSFDAGFILSALR